MAGRHFCVSFADPRDLDVCLQIGASVMLDNGAFSAWTRGSAVNWTEFYTWAERHVRHPHWAVIPDVIDGSEQQNDDLISACPIRPELVAPVWHMHESLDRLRRLVECFPRVCFGSSGAYREPGTNTWKARIDEAWAVIESSGAAPWVHMLRAMEAAGNGPWPFCQRRQHEHCEKSCRWSRKAGAMH